MRSITSLQGQFIQADSNGGNAQGFFWLKRPEKQKLGKLKIDYKKPTPVLLVTKEDSLIFFDKELNQVTYLSIKDSPLEILLHDEKIDSNWVQEAKSRHGFWRITLKKPEASETLTLTFEEATQALKQWQVKDAKGITTTITLYNVAKNIEISDSVFVFTRPKKGAYNPLLDD